VLLSAHDTWAGFLWVNHYSVRHRSGAKPVEGTGIVSEILSGKRKLNLWHTKKLADFFHTSPSVFIS
jgi:antitoxin component HigA of HigAB toxin-antitoxin module